MEMISPSAIRVSLFSVKSVKKSADVGVTAKRRRLIV